MVSDLEISWQELCSALHQMKSDLLHAVNDLTSRSIERFGKDLSPSMNTHCTWDLGYLHLIAKHNIATDFSNNSDTPTALIQTLSTQQRLVVDDIEQAHEELEADLK